jgi:hypothetical protein
MAWKVSDVKIDDQILETRKLVEVGSGAKYANNGSIDKAGSSIRSIGTSFAYALPAVWLAGVPSQSMPAAVGIE